MACLDLLGGVNIYIYKRKFSVLFFQAKNIYKFHLLCIRRDNMIKNLQFFCFFLFLDCLCWSILVIKGPKLCPLHLLIIQLKAIFTETL